ncbi:MULTISPECIES: hypothetical protein [unclassified Nodularia (in: cyanobacteria)]|nr:MULTISPECIES: hypothetical protein [unclassified Nodularia (in: cyanobacteria)]MBE9200205.1 hypothetical protein [Nodularia sp. LEGE 06071]MCC2694246.1 hypothetical protein [Nodularia sp. LEGE 04288]
MLKVVVDAILCKITPKRDGFYMAKIQSIKLVKEQNYFPDQEWQKQH